MATRKDLRAVRNALRSVNRGDEVTDRLSYVNLLCSSIVHLLHMQLYILWSFCVFEIKMQLNTHLYLLVTISIPTRYTNNSNRTTKQ